MFIPHFYNAKSLPKRLVGFENGYENANFIYIYIYMHRFVLPVGFGMPGFLRGDFDGIGKR